MFHQAEQPIIYINRESEGLFLVKIKIIQVGLGSHGTGVGVNAIVDSPDFEYAGLVDVDQGNLVDAGKLLHVDKAFLFTDYNESFSKLDADAVFISAISPVHYEVCKAALEHNLHVLIEKPFVLNMEEGKELVALAMEKNLKLMVDQNYRYNLNVLQLLKVIQEEQLGEIEFVNTQFYYYHDGKPYQKEMDNYVLMEMAIHHIDLIRYILDSNVKMVSGKTWNEENSGYKGDPSIHAVFEMESGVPVFYTGSLLSKGLSTPWEGSWRIQCQHGSIHLDTIGQEYGVYLVNEEGEITQSPVIWKDYEDLRSIFKEFACSIREDREPKISGKDNLQTLATLFATSKSSKEGMKVSPAEFLNG
jgi:predicted dehydrogenase